MNAPNEFGLYLFQKNSQDNKVLKDLLQFLRSTAPGKCHSFSYIEAQSSLHPHMSLIENLQLEIGFKNWKDFEQSLRPEWSSLIKLIKNPALDAVKASNWERFIISLLKGQLTSAQNLLININEEDFSPFLIQTFKKHILSSTNEKTVYLASAHSSLWLDCAHTMVSRKDYQFEVQKLDTEIIKKHWAA